MPLQQIAGKKRPINSVSSHANKIQKVTPTSSILKPVHYKTSLQDILQKYNIKYDVSIYIYIMRMYLDKEIYFSDTCSN